VEPATLLDHAGAAIVVWDLDRSITYWNRRAESLSGRVSQEVLGGPVDHLLFDDREPFEAAMQATLSEGEWAGPLAARAADGRTLTVDSRWTLIRDASGAPRSVMALSTDVTEQERIDRQLRQAERIESLATLAGRLAHDLNNVLAPVMMAIELLRLDEHDEQKLELLELIETSAHRGADIVKQAQSFAQGAEGVFRDLEPASVLDEVAGTLRGSLPDSITLRVDTRPGLWGISGDAAQLHQALLNVAVNSQHAMPDGGELRLGAANVTLDRAAALRLGSRRGDHVRLRVDDTGVGMTREVADRALEPFFTTKPHPHAVGLGLSTVYAIVTSHGGAIDIESSPGAGTRVEVYLPALAGRADPGPAGTGNEP
jgi:PAS domain S-box-containing protein